MKCLCGHIEPESYEKETPIYYQSGKRKGDLKYIDRAWIEPDKSEKFICLGIEKDFSFVTYCESWGNTYDVPTKLYACPKCGTVKMEITSGTE